MLGCRPIGSASAPVHYSTMCYYNYTKLNPVTTPQITMSPRPKTKSKPQLDFGNAWDYSPAPDSTPIEIASKYKLFINGKFVAAKSRQSFDSINPATDEVLAKVSQANAADVDDAVNAYYLIMNNVNLLKIAISMFVINFILANISGIYKLSYKFIFIFRDSDNHLKSI